MMKLAYLLQSVRERIVTDIVQQRRCPHNSLFFSICYTRRITLTE